MEAYQSDVWAAVEKGISNATGAYDISGLKPGFYAVLISAPEVPIVSGGQAAKKPVALGYGKFFFPESDNIEGALPLTLAEGERRRLDIQVHQKPLSRLTGRIDVIGDPPKDIVVDGTRVLGPNSAVQVFHGSPDKAGEFSVDQLSAGEYWVSARGVMAGG